MSGVPFGPVPPPESSTFRVDDEVIRRSLATALDSVTVRGASVEPERLDAPAVVRLPRVAGLSPFGKVVLVAAGFALAAKVVLK